MVGLAAAGEKGRCQDIEAIERSHDSSFAVRPGYGYRRQVDHLSAHGPGHNRSRLCSGIAAKVAVADTCVEAPRLDDKYDRDRVAMGAGLRIGSGDDSGAIISG